VKHGILNRPTRGLIPNKMKAKILLGTIIAILAPSMISGTVHAQGTAFTYQGRLAQGGTDANGNFDFLFGLYTNVSTGNPVSSLLTNAATPVSNGVFTTTLNFSNVFNGTAYWLQIGVRSNGTTNAFVILTPRQPITPTPYAITASNLTGTLPATQLSGTLPANALSGAYTNGVSFTNAANVFAGNGSGLLNVSGITSNIVYAYDTTAQFVNSAGTFQYITFNTAGYVGNWLIPSSGQFEALQAGTYLVSYSAHFGNGNPSSNFGGIIRAVANEATEIAGSEAVVYVPPESIGIASKTFVIQMTAGEVFSLQMTGDIANGTSGGYLDSSTFYSQTFPSINLTIVRLL
jgi:hypothetical protein